jgi:zinc ribbon protein
MILLACPRCGEQVPAGARFCIVCGAVVMQAPARAPESAASATGPTIRLEPPVAPRHGLSPRAGIPLVGLLFSALFLIAFAQVLANNGLDMLGAWPVGLLVGGALFAERAWVNGDIWGGLRGMLLWGGLTGLLALNRVFPWALLLIPIWLMLWLHAHGRRA